MIGWSANKDAGFGMVCSNNNARHFIEIADAEADIPYKYIAAEVCAMGCSAIRAS